MRRTENAAAAAIQSIVILISSNGSRRVLIGYPHVMGISDMAAL